MPVDMNKLVDLAKLGLVVNIVMLIANVLATIVFKPLPTIFDLYNQVAGGTVLGMDLLGSIVLTFIGLVITGYAVETARNLNW